MQVLRVGGKQLKTGRGGEGNTEGGKGGLQGGKGEREEQEREHFDGGRSVEGQIGGVAGGEEGEGY